jgi:hypothetical protein
MFLYFILFQSSAVIGLIAVIKLPLLLLNGNLMTYNLLQVT